MPLIAHSSATNRPDSPELLEESEDYGISDNLEVALNPVKQFQPSFVKNAEREEHLTVPLPLISAVTSHRARSTY